MKNPPPMNVWGRCAALIREGAGARVIDDVLDDWQLTGWKTYPDMHTSETLACVDDVLTQALALNRLDVIGCVLDRVFLRRDLLDIDPDDLTNDESGHLWDACDLLERALKDKKLKCVDDVHAYFAVLDLVVEHSGHRAAALTNPWRQIEIGWSGWGDHWITPETIIDVITAVDRHIAAWCKRAPWSRGNIDKTVVEHWGLNAPKEYGVVFDFLFEKYPEVCLQTAQGLLDRKRTGIDVFWQRLPMEKVLTDLLERKASWNRSETLFSYINTWINAWSPEQVLFLDQWLNEKGYNNYQKEQAAFFARVLMAKSGGTSGRPDAPVRKM